MLKSHSCGELRLQHAGESVTLAGWVHRRRDHGTLIFVDLRGRDGLTQIVFDAEKAADAHEVASQARPEYVLQVSGVVLPRPEGLVNASIATFHPKISILAIWWPRHMRGARICTNTTSAVNTMWKKCAKKSWLTSRMKSA